jgi:hypothetical protein
VTVEFLRRAYRNPENKNASVSRPSKPQTPDSPVQPCNLARKVTRFNKAFPQPSSLPPLALSDRFLQIRDQASIYVDQPDAIRSNIDPVARVIEVRSGVVAILPYRRATAAVLIIPPRDDSTGSVFNIPKDGDFPLYHVASSRFSICADTSDYRLRRPLDTDGNLWGINFERL